jgi:hypothetical protein
MEKNFQTQEARLDSLERQLKSLNHELHSKFSELRADCREKIHEETMSRLDSEYKNLKWFGYIVLMAAIIALFVFF